jgi:hypothetical protein
MFTVRNLSLGLVLSLGFGTAALAGPDLKPKFNSANGSVGVSNVGDADAAPTWVTVSCAASGGGSCPDPSRSRSRFRPWPPVRSTLMSSRFSWVSSLIPVAIPSPSVPTPAPMSPRTASATVSS